MAKDYSQWHILKSHIEKDRFAPVFHEQEIWWCSMGANIGVEIDGKNHLFERPVLVVNKFNSYMFWGLPLTSKNKSGDWYYSFILHDRQQTINLARLRLLSGKRLLRHIGKINNQQQLSVLLELRTIHDGAIKKRTPKRGPQSPCGIVRYANAYLTILLRGLRRLAAVIHTVYKALKTKSS